MPESPGQYGSTGAPLVVGDLVITGVSGGDDPLRRVSSRPTRRRPASWPGVSGRCRSRGEPGRRPGRARRSRPAAAATWLTGSYDPETGLLYWPTGNPFPDTDGDQRGGDNLYTNCVVALDAKTGKLRWHYQFTPHDLHDWDATEPLVLVECDVSGARAQAAAAGESQRLLLCAGPDDRRIAAGQAVRAEADLGERDRRATGVRRRWKATSRRRAGTKTCPAVRGATNWYSTAYNPATRLFYVMAVEDCNIYRQSELGGYVPSSDPTDPPEKYLRAIDIETGKIAWEIPQVGAPEANYSGVLSTAGGLVFYGETGGGFAAVDAKIGRTLWHFDTGQAWRASPMTYMMAGRQYVAIAAGGNILSFALPDR